MTVDGKRVRKPNDVRDPRRRYSQVVAAGETYLLEFTTEQERERDAEEAAWAAAAPEREREAQLSEERAEQFRSSLIYTPRIVAFLDVLGWESAIERSISDPELTKGLGIALDGLRGHVKLAEWMEANAGSNGPWPRDPQVTQFSDTIFVSLATSGPLGDSVETELVATLWSVSFQLIQAGYLVRGAIAHGPLVHKGSVVYGPAPITAHELEKSATFPRIILDDAFATAWLEGIR